MKPLSNASNNFEWVHIDLGRSHYQVAVDDGCLVVRPLPGAVDTAFGKSEPEKVWLSREMIMWLISSGISMLDFHTSKKLVLSHDSIAEISMSSTIEKGGSHD